MKIKQFKPHIPSEQEIAIMKQYIGHTKPDCKTLSLHSDGMVKYFEGFCIWKPTIGELQGSWLCWNVIEGNVLDLNYFQNKKMWSSTVAYFGVEVQLESFDKLYKYEYLLEDKSHSIWKEIKPMIKEIENE